MKKILVLVFTLVVIFSFSFVETKAECPPDPETWVCVTYNPNTNTPTIIFDCACTPNNTADDCIIHFEYCYRLYYDGQVLKRECFVTKWWYDSMTGNCDCSNPYRQMMLYIWYYHRTYFQIESVLSYSYRVYSAPCSKLINGIWENYDHESCCYADYSL